MQRHPLWHYVVAVAVVLVLVNYILFRLKGASGLRTTEIFSAGFLMGMLAMYIAVHVYSWK